MADLESEWIHESVASGGDVSGPRRTVVVAELESTEGVGVPAGSYSTVVRHCVAS